MKRGRKPSSLHGERPNVGELPVEEDVRRELEAHIRLRVEELVAEGWEPAAASGEARRVFGDMKNVAKQCEEVTRSRDRSVRRARALDAVRQDLRYAVRMMRSNPMFTLVALLTLAVGIGANSAIFTVVDGVLLSPLPFQDPEEIVWVQELNQEGRPMSAAWANVRDWREEASSFSALAPVGRGGATVLGGERPVRTTAATVGADFWKVFPVRPVRGRLTTPDDHRPGAAPVMLVSRSFWANELGGGELDVRRLEVRGVDFEVVGVLPEDFAFPNGVELWTPAEILENSDNRTAHNWDVVGRLAPGVARETAQEELTALTERLTMGFTDREYLASGAVVVPLREHVVGDSRRPLLILLAAASLVLLVACTNLASTLLARGVTREREFAVRASLGAGRGRIVRQLLTESVLLAGVGAVLAVGVALGVVRGLQIVGPQGVPRLAELSVDGAVLAYTAAVGMGTALLFGLFPAWRLTRSGPGSALRSGSRGNAGVRAAVWRVLVGGEIALALILLAGSALLLRSFQELVSEDAGFDGGDVVSTRLTLSQIRYPDPAAHARWYTGFLDEVASLPGVESVGIASTLPVSGGVPSGRMELDGDLDRHAKGAYLVVSPDYFEALDIGLLRGRTFGKEDGPDAPHVAVVSRSFADRFWPGQDPLGRTVTGGGMDDLYEERPFSTVVGVVDDVRYRAMGTEARPAVYFPYAQRPFRLQYGASAVVEYASGEPGAVAAALRRTIERLDPDVPVELRTMEERVRGSLAERRFVMLVLGSFSLVALLLAAVGVYGVVSYNVARRTREMGIRMALGADVGSVLRMVVGRAMSMVVGGLVVGVVGAVAMTRLMASLLYEVSPGDPLSLMAGLTLLGLVALLASWLPARSGTKVDPLVSIRAE